MPPMMLSVAHSMQSVPWFNVVTLNGLFQFMWTWRSGESFMSRGCGWSHVSRMTLERHMANVEYESQDAFYRSSDFFKQFSKQTCEGKKGMKSMKVSPKMKARSMKARKSMKIIKSTNTKARVMKVLKSMKVSPKMKARSMKAMKSMKV